MLLACTTPALSAQDHLADARPQARIVARVNDSNRTLLPHTHPASTARMSIGPRVGASVLLHDMVLVLKPTEEQDAALRTAIDLQQDAASPSFHHWLTPDDFALHYGVADRDIATVSAWLQDNGLQVQQLSRSGRFITFSGSVGAVERAFRTELHHILRNGESRVSNTADLSVPSALAPVVRGLVRLDDLYRRQPLPQAPSVQFSSSRQTSASTASAQVAPLYGASASGTHYVGPGDAARVYNALPLTTSGIDGHGTTIVVLGRSNIPLPIAAAFRSTFGLSTNPPTITVVGTDPGIGDDVSEALLDTEWAGALATGASVQLVTSAPSLTGSGVDTAALYAVDNNIGDILTLSYGECESDGTAAGTAFWNTLWQQAAAQGQTVFVSAGDTGAAGCDAPTNTVASEGFGVNALGSSAYNVAVGGSMFVDYGPTQYWSTSSAPPYTSALGYMPEAAWNQGRLSTTDLDATSTGTVTGSGIVSTGGGVSIDTARPSWQTGSQIPSQADPPGSAAGGTLPGLHRLVPDVVMLASFGHNGTLYCGVGMCQGSGGSSSIGVVGGTSVSAPAMASAQALINQRNGGRQGNVNYIYYALAARQSAAGTHCDSTNGTPANPTVTLPDSSCDFHDIVTGSNLVPLSQNNSLAIGFSAASGYDEATGLGSINIANLANDWSSATFHATQTTFTLAPATGVTHGSAQAFTIGVTSAYASGTATPAGNVTLITSSLNAAGAPQVFSLSAGTASGSIATLPAGTYTVHAHYDGDGIFAPSDSAPVAVSIAPEGSIVTLTPKRVDAVGNKVATSGFTYGDALVALDVSVTAHSGNGTPTGALTYTLQGPGSLPTLTQLLNSAGATALLSGPSYASAGLLANYPTLPAGLYTATAAYAGDSNFTVSATTASFTVAKAASVLQLTASQTAPLTGGSPITFTLSIATPPSASAANGTAQFIDTANGVPLCTITLNEGTALCTTSALQTAGTHTVAATYAGDANYLPASATPLQIVVTSTSQPTASLVLTGLSTTFDGTAHSVGVLTTPAGLASTVTYNGAASPPTAAGTYTVVATVHNGSVSGTTTGTLRIAKATPVLTWPAPASVVYGTALSTQQLNATATLASRPLAGTFTWSPGMGTVPPTGSAALQATFQPADTANIAAGSVQTTLTVLPAPASLALTASANPATAGVPFTLSTTLLLAPATDANAAVQFTDNGSSLGSVPVQSGSATLTITLVAGDHTLAAVYMGSANSTGASASLRQTVTSAPTSTFLFSGSGPMALTLASGGNGTLPLTITPGSGFSGSVALSCADVPTNVTCSFSASPLAFTLGSPAQAFTVNFAAAAQHSSSAAPRLSNAVVTLAAVFGWPCLFLAVAGGKRLSLLASTIVALVVLGAATGCGLPVPSPTSAPSTAAPATYTVHVVAAGGTTAQSLPVQLTLQ